MVGVGEPKQASSARMALIYITIGALMDVWTAVYYVYLQRQGATGNVYLWCAGFFCTGLVLIIIGLMVGQIGRSARAAEVAAAPTQVVVPAGTAAPATTTTPVNTVSTTAPTAVHAMPAQGLTR
jgi:hypothetical protein